MKNIESYIDEKYSSEAYSEIEKGIYKCGDNTVTSLCFEQELRSRSSDALASQTRSIVKETY